MSVYCCITTHGIKHVMPINAQIPAITQLLVHRQASIHRYARYLTSG